MTCKNFFSHATPNGGGGLQRRVIRSKLETKSIGVVTMDTSSGITSNIARLDVPAAARVAAAEIPLEMDEFL